MDNKKKIYITNYWHTRNNYGANITAFALQNILQELGYENELLNNPMVINEISYKNCFGFDFQKNYLKTSKYIEEDADQLNENCDTFITGSDQVFRPIYTQGKLDQYLLDFADTDKKKIAFSASFGVDKEQFLKENEKETIEHMKNSLKSFDFISVREKSGVEICRDVIGVDAEWIIDPIFILAKEKWDNLASKANPKFLQQVQNNSIVTYVLDTNDEYKNAYKFLSEKYNKRTLEIANSNISAENWLAAIKNCDLFITDSFHGMCFALIFNKPFICLANKSRGKSRFDSICEIFNLENQCIDSISNVMKKDCIFKFDSGLINKRSEEERLKGLDFLKKALDAPQKITQEKFYARILYLEAQNRKLRNLSYRLKKYLWEKWRIFYYRFFPSPLRSVICFFRGKNKKR